MMVEASISVRILVVEDDVVVGRDIQESLRALGYAVAGVVHTGEEAIRAARNLGPDLILMDIRIPGRIDGVEAARRIGETGSAPVVYLTSYSDDRTVNRAKQTGPFGYLVKPFDQRELKTTVELAIYRHRMERMLEESRERYRLLFEDDVTARYVSTPEGKILDANRAFAELLGFASVDDALDASTLELYRRRLDREEVLRDVRRDGVVRSRRLDLLRADGGTVPVLLHARGVRGEDGSLREIVGGLSDMTWERGLEEKLRRAARMEAAGHVATGLAHDVNNVLSAVRLPLEFVLDDEPLSEDGRREIRAVMDACDRATGLVKRLNAIGGGTGGLAAIRVDLAALVEGMREVLVRVVGRHHRLEIRVEDAPHPVRGIASQLEQVILNLALNARDATIEGGRIVVEVERTGPPLPSGGEPADASPAWIRLTVTDEGSGIDDEVREEIFDPFFTTKKDGSGLGLSVVYGIVHDHGGEVAVESKVGTGTSFHVYLPLADEL